MDTLLKTLGEPRRCEIIRLVWADELAATEIANHFPDVTRPAISQHLGVLKRAGLVKERRQGTRRLYSVDRTELARLRDFIDSFWDESLSKLQALAESDQRVKDQQ